MACIYSIKNTINNKIYIGSTRKKDSMARKYEHWSRLRNNKHCNSKLQRAWNKYGESFFIYTILEELQDYSYACVTSKEIEYISLIKPFYNIKTKITAGRLGYTMPVSTKNKISKTSKGRLVSDETKALIKQKRATQIITREHKEAISKGMKGKKFPNRAPSTESPESKKLKFAKMWETRRLKQNIT